MNRALFQNPACCQYRVCSREAPLRLHEPCAEVPYRISRQWQMPTRGWRSPAASSFMPAKTGDFRQTMGDANHSRTEAFKTRTGLRDLAISQPETSSISPTSIRWRHAPSRPQKPRVLMHRDEAHTARSESPGAAPGLCCREKTCALLFLKCRELLFQGFAHCGNASFRAAGNAQAFRLQALSPGCSILPHGLSRLAAAGPGRNGWRTGYFRFSLRSLRFTAICSRRTSVYSSS